MTSSTNVIYFCDGKFLSLGGGMYNFERFPGKGAILEHDGHPCEVCPDNKPD